MVLEDGREATEDTTDISRTRPIEAESGREAVFTVISSIQQWWWWY